MNRNFLILLIIAVLFAFVLGGGLGILYQTQKSASQIVSPSIKGLSSKVIISSIVARGEVVKIEGKNITLKNEGETLTVNISDNSKIYSSGKIVGPGIGGIKVGDNLQITLKLLPNSQLEGQLILILPLSGVK